MESLEKANELVEKFYETISYERYGFAVECAIIAVDEILKITPQKKDWKESTVLLMSSYGDNPDDFTDLPTSTQYDYWQEVKQHLEEMI